MEKPSIKEINQIVVMQVQNRQFILTINFTAEDINSNSFECLLGLHGAFTTDEYLIIYNYEELESLSEMGIDTDQITDAIIRHLKKTVFKSA